MDNPIIIVVAAILIAVVAVVVGILVGRSITQKSNLDVEKKATEEVSKKLADAQATADKLIADAKRLDGARDDEGLVVLRGLDAPYIDVPDVHRLDAVVDPLRHDLARAAARQDAERIETAGDEQAGDVWRFAHQIIVIRREGLRPAEELADAGLEQDRQALHSALDIGFHALPVGLDLVEAEVLGNAVHVP